MPIQADPPTAGEYGTEYSCGASDMCDVHMISDFAVDLPSKDATRRRIQLGVAAQRVPDWERAISSSPPSVTVKLHASDSSFPSSASIRAPAGVCFKGSYDWMDI